MYTQQILDDMYARILGPPFSSHFLDIHARVKSQNQSQPPDWFDRPTRDSFIVMSHCFCCCCCCDRETRMTLCLCMCVFLFHFEILQRWHSPVTASRDTRVYYFQYFCFFLQGGDYHE